MDGEGAFSRVSRVDVERVDRANETEELTEELEKKSNAQEREINTLKKKISQLAKMNKSQSI